MIVKRGEGNFSETYRPCRISEIRGQEETKNSIKKMLDSGSVENAFLFHGPPGTGKTTLARIIALGLMCEHGPTSEPCCICPSCRRIIFSHSDYGYFEFNVAEIKGIDHLREIAKKYFGQRHIFNETQVFVFDECQKLTKDMQTFFLKAVENAVKEDIFIFCSTELKDFSEPLRDRFTEYEFKKLENSQLYSLINDACENEKIAPKQIVLENIVAESRGKARKAMKNLNKVFTSGGLCLKQGGQIEHLSGKGQILVVAPHGAPGNENDDFTSDIAKRIQSDLGCYAVINEKYSKNQTDLNLFSTIQKDPELETEFLHRIKEYKNEIKEEGLQPLVIYIHGIKEESIKKAIPTEIGVSVIIGYGQGFKYSRPGEIRITLTENYLESLVGALKSNGLPTAEAPPGSLYCGWTKDNLNQLFNLEENKDYYDPDVQSVQLEIASLGLRGNAQEAAETGKRLSEALKALIKNQSTNLENPLDDQKSVTAEIKKVKIDDTQIAGGLPRRVEMRKIAELSPHPLNSEIYGDPNPDDDLKNSIQKNGILTPLIISGDGRIISGHRRFSGAKEFGIEQVPVIILPSCDDLDLEEKLIVANIQRQKTKEQIAREYEKLKKIEGEKSKIRMSLAGGDRKSEEYKRSPTQNSAEPISKGESRKLASAKLGVSHDTAEKSLKVVKSADELKAEGKTEDAQKLLDTLNNKSVNSAYKKVKAISKDQDKAGSLVSMEKTPPLNNNGNFEDSCMLDTVPPKADIEKLEFDQLKQLEAEITLQMEHIYEQMHFFEKRLHILGNCVETISNVLHEKSNNTESAFPSKSNGSTIFSPIKSNYTDINIRHRTNEREVPPGIELAPLPGYYKQHPAATPENDEN